MAGWRERLTPGPALVKANLTAHSGLGLFAAVLLYVLCVSGTAAVFYKDLERWEQPAVDEWRDFDPALLDRTAATMLAEVEGSVDHLVFALPTQDSPRLAVHAGDSTRFVAADGSLGPEESHPFTHFLVELHYALNLPTTLGLTVVGLLGVVLTALVISGLLAHPNLFRDAFHWRRGRSRRLEKVDLHNRIGVWAAPFHLMLAFTGAFIGLSSVLLILIAALFHDGDREAVGAAFFGEDPVASEAVAPLAPITAPVRWVRETHPERTPFYIVVHEPETASQVVDVGVHVPRRLAWAELYRFDGEGDFLGPVGWAEGEPGRQLYAATFRLHFGHFGGLPVKLLWLLLGLSLCVAVASGVDIWLARRRRERLPVAALERAWVATVWGVPLALALTAVAALSGAMQIVVAFWGIAGMLVVLAAWRGSQQYWSEGLRWALAATAALVVLLHSVLHGAAAWGAAGWLPNLLWSVLALAVGVAALESWRARRQRRMRAEDGLTTAAVARRQLPVSRKSSA